MILVRFAAKDRLKKLKRGIRDRIAGANSQQESKANTRIHGRSSRRKHGLRADTFQNRTFDLLIIIKIPHNGGHIKTRRLFQNIPIPIASNGIPRQKVRSVLLRLLCESRIAFCNLFVAVFHFSDNRCDIRIAAVN